MPTPNRADGLSKVFQWHRDIVYKINKRDDNNVNVKLIKYVPPQGGAAGVALDEDDLEEMNQTYDDGVVEGYNNVVLNYSKKPNMSQ